jgi:acetoin utilization deacetylase AcuC-like enzyme
MPHRSAAKLPLTRARRASRRAALHLRPPPARVVHHPGYQPPPTVAADPRRAERILAHLVGEGWLGASQIIPPKEISLDVLARVHGLDHLEQLDDPAVVARALGENDPLPREVAAAIVAAQRWPTAGTVRAAEIAVAGRLDDRGRVVCSLGGGFHHAGPKGAAAFCLVNDVAVAIGELRATGFGGRVLVVDLDLHHGDGTRALFAEDETVFTLSVHAAAWDESPAVASLDVALGPAVGDETYLRALSEALPEAFARAKPDLVFFVAGVDVAADDRLGGWRLSPDAIFERDRRVFEHARGLPVVMVLAGGYGPDAWRYSARTLGWLLGGVDETIPSGAERDLDHFRRIASTIARAELAAESESDDDQDEVPDDFGITAADVYGELVHKRSGDGGLFGLYTVYGLEVIFERYGLLRHLRTRGYPRVHIELDTDAPAGQSVTVRSADARRDVLIELVLQEHRGVTPLRLMSIEWLMMQDPRRTPDPDRPLLPSQKHPGLGALSIMMGMLVMACERLKLDGLTFLPAHFHVASQARGFLEFLEPADEALFAALCGVLGGFPLATSAAMLAEGRVVDARGIPVRWKPARMVLPVSDALCARMRCHEYDRLVEEAAKGIELRLLPVGG